MSDKNKILFLIPNLGKGGAERILAHLLNHLNRDLFSLGCIFYNDKHVHPIPSDVVVFNINLPDTKNIANKLVRYLFRIMKMREIIANYKPHCLMSFLENTPAILSVRFLRLKPIIIISQHNPLEMESGIKRLLAKIFYSYTDRIIAVSQGLRTDIEKTCSIKPESISVIHNPIDILAINKLIKEPISELTWFNENIPVVITAGRLIPQKGQQYLLNAFALLKKNVPARLIILGEGPEELQLKQLAQLKQIDAQISFLGYQVNPFKFIARSSVFVLSSIFEGFGNVLVEAMACGVPVISTDCPVGPREIIRNGLNGILVPPKNIELLAEAMFALLSSKKERQRLSRNALENIRQYDISTIVLRYESILLCRT